MSIGCQMTPAPSAVIRRWRRNDGVDAQWSADHAAAFVVRGCVIGCKLTSSMLRVNKIPVMPLIGPQKIGELTVRTNLPLGGSIEVTGVHSVGAARQLQSIPSLPIAYVPEPGMLVLLVSGLAGLAALHRLRGPR
jgi:hypothetical protein